MYNARTVNDVHPRPMLGHRFIWLIYLGFKHRKTSYDLQKTKIVWRFMHTSPVSTIQQRWYVADVIVPFWVFSCTVSLFYIYALLRAANNAVETSLWCGVDICSFQVAIENLVWALTSDAGCHSHQLTTSQHRVSTCRVVISMFFIFYYIVL